MDKFYSEKDIAVIIEKVETLSSLNAELEELLQHGSNNEKLVDEKREIENSIRKYKSIALQSEDELEDSSLDSEIKLLKEDFLNLVFRYKEAKLKLETKITKFKNGN